MVIEVVANYESGQSLLIRMVTINGCHVYEGDLHRTCRGIFGEGGKVVVVPGVFLNSSRLSIKERRYQAYVRDVSDRINIDISLRLAESFDPG